jgi:hypothetical protein
MRFIFKQFLFIFAVALCICTLSYGTASFAQTEYRELIALPLLPGVYLYATANGSLLFGSGFGTFGNFAIIVIGASIAWASLIAILRIGLSHWFHL